MTFDVKELRKQMWEKFRYQYSSDRFNLETLLMEYRKGLGYDTGTVDRLFDDCVGYLKKSDEKYPDVSCSTGNVKVHVWLDIPMGEVNAEVMITNHHRARVPYTE